MIYVIGEKDYEIKNCKLEKKLHIKINSCRICNFGIEDIFTFSKQAPANSLRKNLKIRLEKHELTLVKCKKCHTLQLNKTVNPKELFNNYIWVTGTSSAAIKHRKYFYNQSIKRIGVKNKKRYIFEIASNDGTFLEEFKINNYEVIGIDPAKNIAKLANNRNIKTIADFFTYKSAKLVKNKYGSPDFVFARNVIPHIENINEVINSIYSLMDEKSIGCIEFHYLKNIYDGLQYDSIYHEHIFYFSLKTITNLLKQHSLYIFDCIKSPLSGGSLIIYFNKSKLSIKKKNYLKFLENEKNLRLNQLSTWKNFAKRVQNHKKEIIRIFESLKSKNIKVCGYGASARSSTFLNYSDLNSKNIICIFDKSKHKHNMYTAGTNIIIKKPNELFKYNPNLIILLAWNFKEEIIKYLKSINYKGKILIPLPKKPYTIQI